MKNEKYLQLTLKLAQKSHNHTYPNPKVGCIIVKNGRIIGQGYHKKYGGPHAEIEALKSCRVSPKGATLYINLEPCCHQGKTPPCTQAIIKAGIKKVVACLEDPNPKVRGKGFQELKKAGIKVENVSLGFQTQAKELNEIYFKYFKTKKPFVVLKTATTLDGKIATRTGDSKWITNKKSRSYARSLRSEYQAILVGINTVLKDNPHLGAQNKKNDPLRIILDTHLKIPLGSKVLRDKNVLIVCGKNASQNKKKLLEQKMCSVWKFNSNAINLNQLLKKLAQNGIISILVEGGSQVAESFIEKKLVDKVYWFIAPKIIGGEKITAVGGKGIKRLNEIIRLKDVEYKFFGENILAVGYID